MSKSVRNTKTYDPDCTPSIRINFSGLRCKLRLSFPAWTTENFWNLSSCIPWFLRPWDRPTAPPPWGTFFFWWVGTRTIPQLKKWATQGFPLVRATYHHGQSQIWGFWEITYHHVPSRTITYRSQPRDLPGRSGTGTEPVFGGGGWDFGTVRS